jgi:anthranilate phosphoribosyltransferase
VCEVRDGAIKAYEITPEELGLRRHDLESVGGGDAAENARIAIAVLEGEPGARQDIVAANAGAALYVSGAAKSIREGIALARESIMSGRARRKLDELIGATRAAGPA